MNWFRELLLFERKEDTNLERELKRHKLCLHIITGGILVINFLPVFYPSINPIHIAALSTAVNVLWIWS